MITDTLSFDVNQTEFPSERSREIWYLGKNIVPLEVSLDDITDTETREGCAQIYQFTREILTDMYNEPEQYPSWNFDLLFNRFIKYGAVPDESGFNWVMPGEAYKKYVKRGGFETVLEKFGFKHSETGDKTILSNEKYPLFLKYWFPFFKLSGKRGLGVQSCDFRVFAKKCKITFDDFLRAQSDRYKAYFMELHEYAAGRGAKFETHYQYRKFRYTYKKEHVLIIETNAFIFVPYNNQYSKKRNPWQALDLFLIETEKQPDKKELIPFIQKHICVCSACSGRKAGPKRDDECCGHGHWLDIHGTKIMVSACHNEIEKYLDPKESQESIECDIHMLKRMIDIRFAQIDNYGNL